MNLKRLSDDDLLASAVLAAANERKATTILLYHLIEIENRRLFARRAFPSMFQYCVDELKMSDSQAARRVNAARLLRQFPELAHKLDNGTLTVSAASQAQAFFKRESFEPNQKRIIIGEIEGKSARDTDKILLKYTETPTKHIRSQIKPITETVSRLTCTIDEETLADLEFLKDVWAHVVVGGDFSKMIKRMAKKCRAAEERRLMGSHASTPTSE